jgi:precorrin-6B methylase 2
MQIHHRRPRPIWIAATVALATSGLTLLAQGGGNESSREQWQKVDAVFAAMAIRPGSAAADVGAGDGFFTSRLAKAVGRDGHVYAVDVSEGAIDRLTQRIQREQLTNVTVVRGTPSDPQLPPGSVDAVLIVNAYHEMRESQAMLAGIRTALRPDGRVVIVEPIDDRRRTQSREAQARNHEIAPGFVEQDAREAGFTIVDLQDPFTRRHDDTEWMMVLSAIGSRAGAPLFAPLFSPRPRWPSGLGAAGPAAAPRRRSTSARGDTLQSGSRRTP